MKKFKKGDRVVYDGSADNSRYYRDKLVKGETYTVLEYYNGTSGSSCINLVEFPRAEIEDWRFELEKKDRFKIGDKVVRIDIGDESKIYSPVKYGVPYTISNYREYKSIASIVHLKEFPEMDGMWAKRFELAKEQPEINQMNNEIAFNVIVNSDETLFRLFEKMAYEAGLKWGCDPIGSRPAAYGLFFSIKSDIWGGK